MDIYGATNLIPISVFAPPGTDTFINKKAKGLFIVNTSDTGFSYPITMKLYAVGGGTITTSIWIGNGTNLILPIRVYSIDGAIDGYTSIYEIY